MNDIIGAAIVAAAVTGGRMGNVTLEESAACDGGSYNGGGSYNAT